MSEKVNIFISYSHKDENHCRELSNHLKPLRRNDLINLWYDREIIPGNVWDDEIKKNLLNSEIILFLLSSDFLASDYIQENEIKTALELHAAGKARLVPILVRKCNLEFTPFSSIQCIPNDLTPIESNKWYTVDDAYSVVASSIINIIKDENEKKQITFSEEAEWRNAMFLDTKEGYIKYLKNSKLKSHFDEVLKKIADTNLYQYKRDNSVDHLEHQLISDTLKHFLSEVHDNISPTLSLIHIHISNLMNSESVYNNELLEIKGLIREVMTKLRDLNRSAYRRLNPYEFIIEPEVLNLVKRYSAFVKINCNFSGISSIKNPLLEINLFRIIQEVFNNIFKYAHAKTVDFCLLKTPERVDLFISDDGGGFDVDSVTEGIGLKNIKARVEYLKGNLAITSIKNAGTKVSIEIPLQ